MDADSPLVSRLERTFWTVWYYISGAVHRLLRPEPENSGSTNPNLLQESAVDSELTKCPHEDEVSDGEVQGEQTLATASALSSSQPAVWDLCTSEIDLEPDEKYILYTADLKDSKTDEDTRDEAECIRTGNGESRLLVAKNEEAEKEGGVNQELYTHTQTETLEYNKNDETMITWYPTAAKSADSGDIACTVEETERIGTPDFQYMEDIPIKIQDQEEDVLNFETDSIEIKLSKVTDLRPKEEVTMHKEEAIEQRNLAEAEIIKNVLLLNSGNENKFDEDDSDDSVQMASNTSVPVSEDELEVAEYAMAPRNSSDKSDIVDERMERPIEEGGQKVMTEDEKVNKAEVLEHKDEIQIVTGDSKEEVNSSAQMWCVDEVLLNAETEPHVQKKLKDVAKDISVQINITETGNGETESCGAATNEKPVVKSSNIINIPADESLFDKNQLQGDSKDSNVERVTPVTVEPEGETGQEVSWELGSIPEYVFKGQSVVAQGPQPPTCKAVRGGVPEYINEPAADENAAQRFLEAGDSEEVWSTPLPEENQELENQELENQELESLRDNTEADYLAMREHTEKGQEGKEDSESYLDLVGSEQETKKQHFETPVQETRLISVKENRDLSVSSVKTGIESDFSLTSEKVLQDREEDVSGEMDEELCDPNKADDTRKRFMGTENLDAEDTVRLLEAGEQLVKTSLQDSVDAVGSVQKINKTLSLIEDITATEFLEQSVVTELQLLTEPEQQYAVTDLEKENNGEVQSEAEVVGPGLGPTKCPETEFSNEKQTKKDEEQLVESVSDTEMSLSTTESGFSDQSLSDWGTQNSESLLLKSVSTESIQDMFGNVSESASVPNLSPQQYDSERPDRVMRGMDEADQSYLKDNKSVTGFFLDSAVIKNLNQESEETKNSTDEDPEPQEEINTEGKGLLAKSGFKTTEEADLKSPTKVSTMFGVEKNKTEWSLSAESSLHDNTSAESEKGSLKLLSVDELKQTCLEDILDIQKRAEVEDQLTTKSEYQSQADVCALDFTAQRSRIAVKNPHVRPPKDPRSLILMSSLDPTPAPHLPAKFPLGGMGIGIKLTGLGAGFPVLKKTQQKGKDGTRPESDQQESETSDTPKQDETQHIRKWMPSRPPGFGNPLMSELKTRLNKTTKD